jgi:integrase
MARKRKPARLLLEERPGRRAVWIIVDRGRKIRTGLFEGEDEKAETALQEYIAQKLVIAGERNAGKVSIAEVLAHYVAEHVPTLDRPDVIERSIPALAAWWEGKTVADVKRSTCNRYVRWRTGTDQEQPNADAKSEDTARRDLVTLEAAINYYHAEFILSAVPAVHKPAKPETSGDWLTRSQVAAALWAAWRGNRASGRRPVKGARKLAARHFARLILIMIYTGTRPGSVLRLQWVPNSTGGWVDVDNGRLYRKPARQVETNKRQPSSAIHKRLLPHLRRWRWQDLGKGYNHVVHYYGKPVDKLKVGWATLRERSKLPEWAIPYTLRHTAATWQMQAGTDFFQAAGLLGMSVEMLRKVYGHHHPDFQSEAAQAVPKKRIA